jgi:hypothetical protein
VGINPKCGIPRTGSGHPGNIANMVACALSILVTLWLIYRCNHRKAAVGTSFLPHIPVEYLCSERNVIGRVELRAFLVLYLITLPLQLISTGSFLEQGTTLLVVFTAIHAGAVAALFWTLLGNAIIATQIVEDGTPSSLVVRCISLSVPSLWAHNTRGAALLLSHNVLYGHYYLYIP